MKKRRKEEGDVKRIVIKRKLVRIKRVGKKKIMKWREEARKAEEQIKKDEEKKKETEIRKSRELENYVTEQEETTRRAKKEMLRYKPIIKRMNEKRDDMLIEKVMKDNEKLNRTNKTIRKTKMVQINRITKIKEKEENQRKKKKEEKPRKIKKDKKENTRYICQDVIVKDISCHRK